MSDVAVRVENLGKKYIIGHQKTGDLRASIGDKFRNLFSNNGTSKEEFWALKDVSFEIKKGEAVGIIGRNGAGKSTLLKLLSRITDPTTGRFEINGRVSSLLEVGTGFHPELSGRENIFLNGTILGMRRSEIKAKFDEIVDFSGVEKFIDTPVKHYSSGMKVRLAFSVAAHLEPEILIVDEVLAVGDAEFQKKCLGKMDEVSKSEGRTVMFVSHNLSAVSQLCTSGFLLRDGALAYAGPVDEALQRYLAMQKQNSLIFNASSDVVTGVRRVEIKTTHADNRHEFSRPIDFYFSLAINEPMPGAALSFQICNLKGESIIHSWIFDREIHFAQTPGEVQVVCSIPSPKLYMGDYNINVFFSDSSKRVIQVLTSICPFVVEMNSSRTEFSWKPGACVYIENTNWNVHV